MLACRRVTFAVVGINASHLPVEPPKLVNACHLPVEPPKLGQLSVGQDRQITFLSQTSECIRSLLTALVAVVIEKRFFIWKMYAVALNRGIPRRSSV